MYHGRGITGISLSINFTVYGMVVTITIQSVYYNLICVLVIVCDFKPQQIVYVKERCNVNINYPDIIYVGIYPGLNMLRIL